MGFADLTNLWLDKRKQIAAWLIEGLRFNQSYVQENLTRWVEENSDSNLVFGTAIAGQATVDFGTMCGVTLADLFQIGEGVQRGGGWGWGADILRALNTVVLRGPVKILGTAPVVTAVNTACRVNFLTGSKLEADQAAFTFAGPLVLQAGPTAEASFVKSSFSAPSVSITEGTSSILNLTESTVKATAGNITIALGAAGQVTASLPYAGQQSALEATGAISITGGARSTFSLVSASGVAGTSFGITFNGTEGTFQLQDSVLTAAGGPLSVIAPGTLANFDLSSARLNAASGIVLAARGREGRVTGSQVQMDSGNGSIEITAGAGAAIKGAVRMSDLRATSGGAVTILASRNATEGEAVVEVSNIRAQGNIRIESGIGGITTVLNNGLTSPTLIRAFAPPSGSCVAENNAAVAPLLQLCQ